MRTDYYSADRLRYSFFNNAGVYEIQGEELVSLVTGERFSVMKACFSDKDILRYREYICDPPICGCYDWPADVVELADGDENVFTREFTKKRAETRLAGLLFPEKMHPEVKDLSEVLRGGKLSPRDIAVLITREIDDFNRGGYGYGVIEYSSLLFGEDGSVIPGFTPSVFSWLELWSGSFPAGRPGKEDYSLEFADPAYVNGGIDKVDLDSQNHSLRAMLFYVLTGRLPYDGSLLSGYSSDTPFYRQIKLRDYHKYSVFIFDGDNDSNSVGQFKEEKQIVEAWNSLPDDIKKLFLLALGKKDPKKHNDRRCPTASVWLEAFARAGWDRQISMEG